MIDFDDITDLIDIKKAIDIVLNEKEKDILVQRMDKTLKEVGESYGVSGARIRQIEARATRKVRAYFYRSRVELNDK
jgi:RNA polymerase sigma factor (sigma-70 family)